MAALGGGGLLLMSVPLYMMNSYQALAVAVRDLNTSVLRYSAEEPGQWLQRHPEAGSSWPSWPTVLPRP